MTTTSLRRIRNFIRIHLRPISPWRLLDPILLAAFLHGLVRHAKQRFYIYAERGLARRRVTLWFFEDHLHVEYKQTLLARYRYRLERHPAKIDNISRPKLYRTQFASPQLELLELDDKQWTKIARRPPYAKRHGSLPSAFQQLALDFPLLSLLFFWF